MTHTHTHTHCYWFADYVLLTLWSFCALPMALRFTHTHTHTHTHAVRDFMGLVGRWFRGDTMSAERDIDNAYRELPKEGVFKSVEEAAPLARKHRNMRVDFFFGIARGGERLLDRTGKVSDKGFRVVPLDNVLNFVCWDINCNTTFEYNGWVLNQNIKGVPVGGFQSAQLLCPWALVKEITCQGNYSRG